MNKRQLIKGYTSAETVLGGLLKNRGMVERVSRIVGPKYFQKSDHVLLFHSLQEYNEQINEMDNADWKDTRLFSRWLTENQRLAGVGGIDYLEKLCGASVSGTDAVMHAEFVQQDYYKRQAAKVCSQATKDFNNGASLAELPVVMEKLGAIQAESECETKGGMSLNIIRADQIQEEELTWFWRNRIPEGMYSFLVGDPGAGKSFLSCYFAAIASTGGIWADGSVFGDPMDVLMFVSEDHLSKSFKPRLRASGADMSRIHICQWMKSQTKEEIPFVIQQNIDLLEKHLDQNPQIKLVTLDPITGYMGDAQQNLQADVRNALMPVKCLAEKKDVTIIGLSHLNKKADQAFKHRSIGSVAFNAVPRAVWGVEAIDDEDGDIRRIFFPIKDNICISPDALEFGIVDDAIAFKEGSLSRQEVGRLMSRQKPTKVNHAKTIILDALKNGPVESNELIKIIMDEGMSERTATNARKELRDAKKIDTHNPNSEGWVWFLLS